MKRILPITILMVIIFIVFGLQTDGISNQKRTVPPGTCVCNSKVSYPDPWMCPYEGQHQAVETMYWKERGNCTNKSRCWSGELQKYVKCDLCYRGYGIYTKDVHDIFWTFTCHSKLEAVLKIIDKGR